MRGLLLSLAALLLASLGGTPPASGGTVVNPGEDHTLPGGIELVNGSPENHKRAKLKHTYYDYTVEDENGQMIDKSGDHITASGNLRDSGVLNIEEGTIVDTGKDVELVVTGKGGKVNIGGSKYDIKVTNTAKKPTDPLDPGPQIEVSFGDGSTALVGPGSTVSFKKGKLS